MAFSVIWTALMNEMLAWLTHSLSEDLTVLDFLLVLMGWEPSAPSPDVIPLLMQRKLTVLQCSTSGMLHSIVKRVCGRLFVSWKRFVRVCKSRLNWPEASQRQLFRQILNRPGPGQPITTAYLIWDGFDMNWTGKREKCSEETACQQDIFTSNSANLGFFWPNHSWWLLEKFKDQIFFWVLFFCWVWMKCVLW